MKIRLDAYLCREGYFKSRSEARAAVMEGLVSIDRCPGVKPGTQVTGNENIIVRYPESSFVSRGGIKLKKALDCFDVLTAGKVALDIGSSTGGFTDCLLSEGASTVIAVDVGKGQLHWKLRNDPRVRVLESTNARYITREDIPENPALAVVDVSFISLTKVLDAVINVLADEADIVTLVKPQFEAGREKVGKGGVVKEIETHIQVLSEIVCWISSRNIAVTDVVESPIKGPKGNIEFFLHLRKGEAAQVTTENIVRVVHRAHLELE
ncbi:MAG: TlyA family RNA methyltransferase [Actinobacteria bacterium]|nr:TlyA family RNA methyltransferase [Actinomycetota bacterium]